MDITITKLTRADLAIFTELIYLYEEVFEMAAFTIPSEDYLQSLLQNSNMIFYVARLNGQVIGGLTAHILPSTYFENSEVYIFDLAVKADHQRKGVGKQLVYGLREYCLQQGYKEIFVQADEEDTHAISFYHATGGVPEKVVHFNYPLD